MYPRETERRLIVNADDFGLSPGVNAGIVEAVDRGIVTSASLMVFGVAAEDAVRLARTRPGLSIGLHVDLGEWAFAGGSWTTSYEVVALDDEAAVREEVSRQRARFLDLVGRPPTHIDSHQHVHLFDPVKSVVLALADALRVPARGLAGDVGHCGDFYGQTGRGEPLSDVVTVEGLTRILAALPPGTTELGCHPGRDPRLASVYRSERTDEVAVLTDPRVRSLIERERIELISFTDVGAPATLDREAPSAMPASTRDTVRT